MNLEAERGLTLTIYTAEPDTSSADRMQLLASRAASEYGTTDGGLRSSTSLEAQDSNKWQRWHRRLCFREQSRSCHPAACLSGNFTRRSGA